MKNKLFFMIIIVLLLIYLINQDYFFKEKDSVVFQSNFENTKNLNGAVINIWIDEQRIDNLKKHKIKYLLVDLGDTNKDGIINTPKEEIISFLDIIGDYENKNNYDFIILPYSEIDTYKYNFDSSFQKNFIQDYKNLKELGFDGLLVDVEPVKFSQRETYLEFLDELNEELPEKAIISVYSGFISDDKENEWEWDIDFYKKVSDKVDLISFPGYDTDLSDKNEYQSYIKEQIYFLTSNNLNSDILLAIPTHKSPPETIENALEAYSEEIKNNESRIIGVVIFAEWTTDNKEWGIFEKYMI